MADQFDPLVIIEQAISAGPKWKPVTVLQLPFGGWRVTGDFMYCGPDGVDIALIRGPDLLSVRTSNGGITSWEYGSIECDIPVEDIRAPIEILAQDIWSDEEELAEAPRADVMVAMRSQGSKHAWLRELRIFAEPSGS